MDKRRDDDVHGQLGNGRAKLPLKGLIPADTITSVDRRVMLGE